ncbi:hypothetical protein DPMN_078226 [Dreissena polymorpha]|uniref:Uncharacterized protein n=1 Tax=Dreissena polymorpha TaxID=45954 RepID=A0A9D3YQ51_DREPO|nr:hypothetical protein DPMN_078226 [Dreissena polymorpha]
MIRSAYKLQYSESETMRKIGLQHEMNKNDRLTEWELRKEAKQRQDKSPNENFRFLVRGPIGNRKIIQVKMQKTVAEDPGLEAA